MVALLERLDLLEFREPLVLALQRVTFLVFGPFSPHLAHILRQHLANLCLGVLELCLPHLPYRRPHKHLRVHVRIADKLTLKKANLATRVHQRDGGHKDQRRDTGESPHRLPMEAPSRHDSPG